MFDPDEAGKAIRIQKLMGVLPGDKPLCERCGRPVPTYQVNDFDVDENGKASAIPRRGEDERIWDRFCGGCGK